MNQAPIWPRAATVFLVIVTTSRFTEGQSTFIVPSSATPSIQSAIDRARSGDEIQIRPGTYRERIDLAGKGILLRSMGGPAVTILDGESQGTVITCARSETRATQIRGLTIRRGLGSRGQQNTDGGGAFLSGSSPTFSECVFEDNLARDAAGTGGYGGAIFTSGGAPLFTGCLFRRNVAGRGPEDGGRGGAAYADQGNPEFQGCTFQENRGGDAVPSFQVPKGDGGDGGAILMDGPGTLHLQDCLFLANVTGRGDDRDRGGGGAGGGLHLAGAHGIVRGCTFLQNRGAFGGDNVGGAGGAVIFRDSTADFENCLFIENESGGSDRWAGDGSALYMLRSSPNFVNCLFTRNAAGDARTMTYGIGGDASIMIRDQSSPLFLFCTIADNSAGRGGVPGAGGQTGGLLVDPSSATTRVYNSILAHDVPREILGTADVRSSNVFRGLGTPLPGTGNMDRDPRFQSRLNGNYSLSLLSPCIERGLESSPYAPSVDLAGHSRALGASDMGCYEAQPGIEPYGQNAHPNQRLVLQGHGLGQGLSLSGASPGSFGFMLYTAAPGSGAVQAGVPIHVDLSGGFGIFGFQLDATGAIHIPLPLAHPSLTGLHLFTQGFEILEPGPWPMATSGGLALLFGTA